MMENHGFAQVISNANMPFTNKYAQKVNSARKYFAVGHPSLTNYLEVVGGSNFGIRDDNSIKYENESEPPLFEMGNSFGGAAGNFGNGAIHSVGASYHPGPADIEVCTAIGIFMSAGLTPVILNLCMIAGALWLSKHLQTPILALGIATVSAFFAVTATRSVPFTSARRTP